MWYTLSTLPEHFHKPNETYGKLICQNATYTLGEGNDIQVLNQGYDANRHRYTSITGRAYAKDPSQPARLSLHLDGVPFEGNYWLIDTDYDNYALVYSCSDLPRGMGRLDQGFVLSRGKNYDDELVKRLTNQLVVYGVDPSQFERDFQSCQ